MEKNSKGHTPHLEVVLRKMCSMAGMDYDDIDFQSNWYMTACWAESDQERFIKWLSDYLYKNLAARQELTGRTTRIRSLCTASAKEFAWNYGWVLWG